MAPRRGVTIAACAFASLLAWPPVAAAQGKGQGNAYGQKAVTSASTSTGPSAAGSEALAVAGTGVRTFGSWLDDASVMPPGTGFVSVGVSFWKTPAYREIDAPTMDTGLAITRRAQVAASIPYYYAGEPGGPVSRGFGDTYLSLKVQLRDPAAHGAGLAVTPLLQVMNSTPVPGTSRVSWALPVNVEVQRSRWRAYGSAGYFSRGALFASAAVEAAVGSRTWVTGTISQSHSVRSDEMSVALGLAQTRTDVSGGASLMVRPGLAAYASLGRTISKHDANSTSLLVAGGVAFAFGTAKEKP